MRTLFVCLFALLPALASAQVAPTVVSTLKTTSTAATSIQVGCAVGSSVCTGGIVAGPIDVASVTSGGFIGIASSVPGVTTYRLYNNAGTLTWNGVPLATGASLSGTTGTIPLFTGASTVGDSIMTQSGTTITVANTIAATTGTFTNVAGTLSTASQPNVTTLAGLTSASSLATVGTISSGTWNGTAISLTYGGTGQNLSGTGGTSQFLRQNTVGGAITPVRPALADLSDAASVVVTGGSYSDPAWITALSASKLTSGALPDARLSANVPLKDTANTYTSAQTFNATASVWQTFTATGTDGPALIVDSNAGGRRVEMPGYLVMSGIVTPGALVSNTNNWTLLSANEPSFVYRAAATSAIDLTGILGGGSGTYFWLFNGGVNTITLKYNSGSSSAGARFYTPGGVDYSLTTLKSVMLYYSATDAAWLVLGGG